MKLTTRDWYKSNDPEYLEDHPAVKYELIKQISTCKPAVCEQCFLFKPEFNDDLTVRGAMCALDRHPVEYGKLSKDCAVRWKNGQN